MLARAYGTMMISSTVVGAHLGAYHTFLSGEPYFFERTFLLEQRMDFWRVLFFL
jgi:hypothetical protein